MGILVQRQFTVAGDDRAEFERQSRLGVWEDMRYNGAQMIAFGSWAFGAPGDVVVTHSVYADFDHWTATRPWGAFRADDARREETAPIRAIYAGRPRLIALSRATIIDYDSELSAPNPFYRHQGDPLAVTPPTFGRQSIVDQTRFTVTDAAAFKAAVEETTWPAFSARGARPLIFGFDPLAPTSEIITLVAFRDISHWHEVTTEARGGGDLSAHGSFVETTATQLLMVQTSYGEAPR